jgi:hypothetical protein
MSSFKVTAKKYIGGKSSIDKKTKEVIFNSKVIDRGESVIIDFDVSPSAKRIEDAFKSQLKKMVKGSISTDFFKIERM